MQYSLLLKNLYMFQVVTPPTIRNSKTVLTVCYQEQDGTSSILLLVVKVHNCINVPMSMYG
jgi:hypothetical protein